MNRSWAEVVEEEERACAESDDGATSSNDQERPVKYELQDQWFEGMDVQRGSSKHRIDLKSGLMRHIIRNQKDRDAYERAWQKAHQEASSYEKKWGRAKVERRTDAQEDLDGEDSPSSSADTTRRNQGRENAQPRRSRSREETSAPAKQENQPSASQEAQKRHSTGRTSNASPHEKRQDTRARVQAVTEHARGYDDVGLVPASVGGTSGGQQNRSERDTMTNSAVGAQSQHNTHYTSVATPLTSLAPSSAHNGNIVQGIPVMPGYFAYGVPYQPMYFPTPTPAAQFPLHAAQGVQPLPLPEATPTPTPTPASTGTATEAKERKKPKVRFGYAAYKPPVLAGQASRLDGESENSMSLEEPSHRPHSQDIHPLVHGSVQSRTTGKEGNDRNPETLEHSGVTSNGTPKANQLPAHKFPSRIHSSDAVQGSDVSSAPFSLDSHQDRGQDSRHHQDRGQNSRHHQDRGQNSRQFASEAWNRLQGESKIYNVRRGSDTTPSGTTRNVAEQRHIADRKERSQSPLRRGTPPPGLGALATTTAAQGAQANHRGPDTMVERRRTHSPQFRKAVPLETKPPKEFNRLLSGMTRAFQTHLALAVGEKRANATPAVEQKRAGKVHNQAVEPQQPSPAGSPVNMTSTSIPNEVACSNSVDQTAPLRVYLHAVELLPSAVEPVSTPPSRADQSLWVNVKILAVDSQPPAVVESSKQESEATPSEGPSSSSFEQTSLVTVHIQVVELQQSAVAGIPVEVTTTTVHEDPSMPGDQTPWVKVHIEAVESPPATGTGTPVEGPTTVPYDAPLAKPALEAQQVGGSLANASAPVKSTRRRTPLVLYQPPKRSTASNLETSVAQ